MRRDNEAVKQKRPFIYTAIYTCMFVAVIFVCLITFVPFKSTLEIVIFGSGSEAAVTAYKTDDIVVASHYKEEASVEGNGILSFTDFPVPRGGRIDLDVSGTDTIVLSGISYDVFAIPVFHLTAEQIADSVIEGEASVEDGSAVFTGDPDEMRIAVSVGDMQIIKAEALYIALLLLPSILAGLLLAWIQRKMGSLSDNVIFKFLDKILIITAPAVLIVVAGEALNRGIGFIDWKHLILNYMMACALFLIASAVLGIRGGVSAGSLCLALLYVANYYVTQFRGRSILPWDIFGINTAAAVASTYEFKITFWLIALILVTAAAIITTFAAVKRNRKIRIPERIICLAMAAVMFLMVWNSGMISRMKIKSWDSDIIYAYKDNGVMVAALKYYKDNRITKPEGYSAAEVEKIYEKYKEADNSDVAEERADKIIVIMNESFADMDKYCDVIDVDDIPYFEEIRKECVTGELYVSVRGGGTCNTEFEALTGNSMAFLPDSSYPFTMYMKTRSFSIAEYLKAQGYETAALHIEKGSNWGRNKAYETLSLEPFYTVDDYPDAAQIRGRATDAFNYECIEEIDDNMDSDEKFIFNVTIQNHGGYDDPMGMDVLYDLSEHKVLKPAEVYFSLMKYSDDALKDLISHYAEDDEKTMIVFFGDHQPSFGSKANEFIFGQDAGDLDRYNTPFIIWKNYGNESRDAGSISANILPVLILEEAGYPLTPYLSLVKAVGKEFPVMTTMGIVDKDGNYYEDTEEVIKNSGLLLEYWMAEYNNIFDRSRRMEKLFMPE